MGMRPEASEAEVTGSKERSAMSSDREARRQARATVPLAALFVGLCGYPHLLRLERPSLYCDDVVRVAVLQVLPLRSVVFRPFNEHMAPLFDVVSWATWELAGRRLTLAPRAFTWAGLAPFVLSLGVLGLLVRREARSTTAALVAVAVFGISTVYLEAAWWYSASSFTWALLATLLAWLGASGAGRSDRPGRGWAGAALAAALAPAFSGIGLLAGPVAALRALSETDRTATRRRVGLGVVIPLAGTLAYLAACSLFRYRDVLAESVRRNADARRALLATCRAPFEVLLPRLVGLREAAPRLSDAAVVALFAIGLLAGLAWARRSPRRPLILGGLFMIVGGYALAYSVRATYSAAPVLTIQRYHLFPQVGLALTLAAASVPWSRRLDARPAAGLAAASALAALLLAVNLSAMKGQARAFGFPEQGRTLAALEHVAATCRREGITRDQALAALDPIRPRWFPLSPSGPIDMLPITVATPRVPDERVRPTLLAALAPAEREALCGASDASPHLRPISDPAGAHTNTWAVGHLVRSVGVGDGAASRPAPRAFLEFELRRADSGADGPRALCVPGAVPAEGVQVWWAGDDGRWSELRSIFWRPDPARPASAWAVALDRLPHWDPNRVRRIRLYFPGPTGPVAVGPPRILAGDASASTAAGDVGGTLR
jgi:hypothetical protein